MKIKTFRKILAVIFAASTLTFGGMSAQAVKPRPMATIGMVAVLDRCDAQIELITDLIKSPALREHLANAPKNKDLVEVIESTLSPLKNLYVDHINDANSLRTALRKLHAEILALIRYFNGAQIDDEDTIINIRKVILHCVAVSFMKTRILINAEALDMQQK